MSPSPYTDGFVIPVPKSNLDAYRAMAETAGKVWREYGALDYKECVLEDARTEHNRPFTQGVDAKPDETVIFSWILYASREERDRINARVMEDPRIKGMCGGEGSEMPFDFSRMLYGGFEVIVDAFEARV